MNTTYKSNNNIVYSCKYHVVWCPKYRRKILTNEIDIRLKELLLEYAANIFLDIMEMEIMPDHVHILMGVDPQFGIHKAVKSLKGYTSKVLRSEFPSLKTKMPSLWTNNYFVSTIGGAPLDIIKQYIGNQKTSQRQKDMLMQKGIKFRIYPNMEQKNLINQTLGCCRLVYNRGLAMRKDAFRNGNKIGYSQTSAMLTDLKKSEDFAFLKAADSIALQQALRDLDSGYVNFFQKRAAHPTFKSKHNHHQSYRTINQGDNIRIAGRYIKLPKLGFVKMRQSMDVGRIHNVTIERTPTGKYFAVLNVEFEPQPMSNMGGIVGIDVGIKEFYSDSNGNVVSNPKYFEKSMHKLVREQRKLSRKEKGSNNRDKQRVKVALVHEKITNQRNDFLQKQSSILICENQTICMEDLNIKGMIRNHKLAKSIASVSWSKFFTMLEYKAAWYGNEIIKVPTMYPSSQICSCCGYKNPLVKNLAVRQWECPVCHTKHDRDTNASINILNKGLQMQSA